MPKVTVSVPDKLLVKFKKDFPEVNVAAVARRVVVEKIEELKSKGVV